MSWYFDEYLKKLPRDQWTWEDMLSYQLKIHVRHGTRVYIPDGTSCTVPHQNNRYYSTEGPTYADLCGVTKAGKLLVYVGRSPLHVDPFDIMYFTDDDELVSPHDFKGKELDYE